MTFDPFATDSDWKPKAKATLVADKYRPSIVERARKRTVVPEGERKYRVSRLDKELLDWYQVHFEGGKWVCVCYDMDHGDTRRRVGCSHVVAVLLHREAIHTPPRLLGQDDTQYPKPVIPPREGGMASRRGTLPPVPTDPIVADIDPLPEWVEEIRQHQWDAVEEAVEAFNSGIDIVYLDGPTGTGKTLIAELIRRRMKVNGLYVCNTKTLQDQFVQNFPYAKVLKGRDNYPTLDMAYPEYTAADCNKEGVGDEAFCYWCRVVQDCPYEKAKVAALRARLAVINTAYLLTEANNVGKFSGRDLVIADEADTLEQILMGFVTYSLSDRRLERLGLHAPKPGSRKTTILRWLEDELLPKTYDHLRTLPSDSKELRIVRERNGVMRLIEDTRRVVEDLRIEIESLSNDEDEQPGVENWIRDNKSGPMVLKPVRVENYGGRMVWGHGKKWLCMSASFVSTEEISDSLGVHTTGLKTKTINVPMLYPVENREVVAVPLADMTNSKKDSEWPKAVRGIDNIASWFPDVRILVHTVSYKFTEYLLSNCSKEMRVRCVTYKDPREREAALQRYRQNQSSILLAPSMDRGIDLKDDDCRVIIIPKVPFPNLGDRQIGSRLRGPGGQAWYNVLTIRTLVQMTGRGVRSMDDWCNTFILDAQFIRKIWNRNKGLLPKWWREAVKIGQVKDFL